MQEGYATSVMDVVVLVVGALGYDGGSYSGDCYRWQQKGTHDAVGVIAWSRLQCCIFWEAAAVSSSEDKQLIVSEYY